MVIYGVALLSFCMLVGIFIGEMIGKAIRARLREIASDYWFVAFAVVCFGIGMFLI